MHFYHIGGVFIKAVTILIKLFVQSLLSYTGKILQKDLSLSLYLNTHVHMYVHTAMEQNTTTAQKEML